jgi:hypothetical protein
MWCSDAMSACQRALVHTRRSAARHIKSQMRRMACAERILQRGALWHVLFQTCKGWDMYDKENRLEQGDLIVLRPLSP